MSDSTPVEAETRDDAPIPEPLVTTRLESPTSIRIDSVASWAAVAITLVLGLMLAHVLQLQVAPGRKLAHFMSECTTTVPQQGSRGDLLDRRGRVQAATCFGQRVFVDPWVFPNPPDEPLRQLAGAVGMPIDAVAKRIIPKIASNERIMDPLEDPVTHTCFWHPPIRYVSLGGVLDDWKVDSIKALKIPGVYLETRPVRESPGDDLVASLLGKVGTENKGLMGAEKMFDRALQPMPGRLRYVRDASGRALWVDPGGYVAPQRGSDVRMSMDMVIQAIVQEELKRGVEDADAAGGRCVVLDPRTGEVLAMEDIIRPLHDVVDYDWAHVITKEGSHPRYRTIHQDSIRDTEADMGHNRCVEDVYEPGSTFKPFMWSSVNELHLAKLDEVINTEGGHWVTPYGRHLDDVVKRDHQTWREVLINSSNIGMAKTTGRMTFKQTRDAVLKFGFGAKTGIGIPGESTGLVTTQKAWSKYTQTSVAYGHEVGVTPLQMVRGFSAFARTGELAGTLPTLRLTAVNPEQAFADPAPRVIPRGIAETTRDTMRGVTHNLDMRLTKKDPEANQFRYEAFGKSGTAEIPLGKPPPGKKKPRGSDGYFRGQYNSSFIAGGPVEEPRLVIVVVIDDPGPEKIAKREHYGAATAGPVVRRIMERSLTYLAVPPSYPSPPTQTASAGQHDE